LREVNLELLVLMDEHVWGELDEFVLIDALEDPFVRNYTFL